MEGERMGRGRDVSSARLRASQLDPKTAPFSMLGLNPHASAHALHDFAYQGQPDAGSFVLGAVQPLEHAE